MKRLQFAFEEEDQEKVLCVCLRVRERVGLILSSLLVERG